MRFAAALAGKFDAPAGAADASNRQVFRRDAGDPPARHRGGRQRERILVASPPALQHQSGGAFLFRRELEPAGGRHGEAADLPDHRGKAALAKALLHHGKHILIAHAFRLEQLMGRQADLRQGRSEQIPPFQGPKNRAAAAGAPRCYPGREQSGGCIVAEARIGSSHFMQGAKGEAVSAQFPIDLGYSKRQIFPRFIPSGLDRPDLGAQGFEPLTWGW
jgi:hypothetical protein